MDKFKFTQPPLALPYSLSLPLTSGLGGIVKGGVTFTRASAQWGTDDSGALVQVASGIPFINSKGVLCEPASTNKCTCYGTIPADSYGSTRTSGYALILGVKYEIVSRATLDFTTCGAANNSVGTQFIATGGTLGAGDSVKDVLYGIGTKSYYTGGAFKQNHTNMTLASTDTANPPTLTTIDGTADLTAAGLLSISQSGKWYQAVNPAGSAATAQVKITGNTGNTNNHSYFVIGKQTGGAFLSTVDAGADGVHNVNLPAAVGKVLKENVAIPVSTGLYIGLPPGATAWFFLPQLEEQSACTSPMPSQGAAATRAAVVLTFPVTGNLKTNDFTIYCEVTPYTTSPSQQNYLSTGASAGSGFLLYVVAATNLSCNKYVAGVVKGSSLASGVVAGATRKVAFRVSSASGEATFSGGVKGATVNADTAAIPYSASVVSIGSYQPAAGNNPFFGYVRNIRIFKSALPDARCIAMTT